MKPPIPIGRTIDNRYKIVRVLGEGAFGRVYLAEHRNGFGEKCAIKEFAPDAKYAYIPKVQELFDRECRNLQKLQHAQIPRFRELLPATIDNNQYILLVQDFIEGENYYQILNQRNPFSEVEVVDFLRQILPVLSYIHHKGIIHRDISPDNIVCRKREGRTEPVLIDFGIIKVLSNQYTQVHTIVGKPGYSPDEQLKGSTVSPSSDLYAIAATILFLLSKKQPSEFYQAYNAKFNLSTLPISPEFRNILDRMLSFAPRDRYQSATDVMNALSTLPASLNPQPAIDFYSNQQTPKITPSMYYLFQKADIWGRFKKDFRQPFMQVGAVVVTLFIIIFILNTIFTAIAGLFNHPKPSTSTVSSPNSNNSNAPIASKPKQDLAARMKAAKVSNKDVDRIFHQRHPNRRNKPITDSDADRPLAQEWQQIAEDLIAKSSQN